MDVQDAALLLELLDLHGDLVGHLGAELAHHLLAHQFGGEEARAAVGELVFLEEVLAFGQVPGHQRLEGVETLPVQRGDRHDLGIGQLLGQPLEVRQQLALVFQAVDLVDHQQQRAFDEPDPVEDHLVLVGPARAVDDEDHHVDVLERRAGAAVHVAVERLVVVLVHAGGIDIDRLHRPLGLDAEQGVPGGLRLARGDRQLLAEDVIEQGRLADVRPADDGHIAAAARGFSHCHSPRPGPPVPPRPPPVRRCGGWHPGHGSCH